MKPPLRVLMLAIAFDVYWTLVVLFRHRGIVLWLVLALMACLMLKPLQRINAMLLALSGGMMDTMWSLTGLIKFNDGGILPLWMMAPWLMFACVWIRLTANTTLPGWMLVLVAAMGGPTAYWLGERLGGIVFVAPIPIVLGWMALGWGVLMLVFHLLARRH